MNGIRYFATGDIGELTENGNFRIIDRKKDLVKLQGGEYLSLNKVEAVIKLMPFVDNCCVVAKHSQKFSVCLVSPNVKKIDELWKLLLIEASNGRDKSCADVDDAASGRLNVRRRRSFELLNEFMSILERNKAMVERFRDEMTKHCLSSGLQRFEVPSRVRFVKETWLPDSGLVTDSLKLKRKEIERFYSREIEILYAKS